MSAKVDKGIEEGVERSQESLSPEQDRNETASGGFGPGSNSGRHVELLNSLNFLAELSERLDFGGRGSGEGRTEEGAEDFPHIGASNSKTCDPPGLAQQENMTEFWFGGSWI